MTIHERLHNYPPILLRLLSKDEAASYYPCERDLFWDPVPIGTATCFMRRCGVDLFDSKSFRRAENYLRNRPQFSHLRKSKIWASYYRPMLLDWAKHSQPTCKHLIALKKRLEKAL